MLHRDDKFTWGMTPDGSFTTKSAYKSLMGGTTITPVPNMNCIWKWRGNERIRTFLWKLSQEAFLTNAERLRRRMATSSSCPFCAGEEETLFHRFRDCRVSAMIWSCFKVRNQGHFFSNITWFQWLEVNLRQSDGRNEELNWSILFGVTLDILWRN